MPSPPTIDEVAPLPRVPGYNMHVTTDKEEVLTTVSQMPGDWSMEAILAALYVKLRIARGIDEAERGDVVSTAELKESVREWRSSSGR